MSQFSLSITGVSRQLDIPDDMPLLWVLAAALPFRRSGISV